MKDYDVYSLLGHTIPPPTLPDQLVFTPENLEERVMLAERTAIVFYIGCEWLCVGEGVGLTGVSVSGSAETKLLLHHLLAAWERLDTSECMPRELSPSHTPNRCNAGPNLNVCAGESVQLGSVDCHAHTRTCSRFAVTVLPHVLLFTPSSFPSPTPILPPLGVIDSTHLLQALGQGVESEEPLVRLQTCCP